MSKKRNFCEFKQCEIKNKQTKKKTTNKQKNSYGEWSPPNSILTHKINMHLKLNN